MSETPSRRQTEASVSPRYEQRDVAVGRLALFGLGLGAGTLAFFLLMWVLFGELAGREATRSQPANPLSEAVGRRLPPLPRLEPNLPMRLAELHRHENAVLSTYGWVDRDNGVVRIPLKRAMDLLTERYARTRDEKATGGANDE